MFKTVLAVLSGTDCDRPVLSTGFRTVVGRNGHIECLRLMPDPADLIAQAAQVEMGSMMLLSDTITAIEQEAKNRTEQARTNFTAFCQSENIQTQDNPNETSSVTAAFREEVGDEYDRVMDHARTHDLVILAGGNDRPGRLPEEALGGIIIGSGRPVLLAPADETKAPFRRVAIAWKDAAEAARAVTAAMPILENASRIDVYSVCEQDKRAGECVKTSDALVNCLRWHGLNATSNLLVPEGRPAADAVLDGAQHAGADLLVMGGYGHSRLREFVFGGFTQRILKGASLPVLLFH